MNRPQVNVSIRMLRQGLVNRLRICKPVALRTPLLFGYREFHYKRIKEMYDKITHSLKGHHKHLEHHEYNKQQQMADKADDKYNNGIQQFIQKAKEYGWYHRSLDDFKVHAALQEDEGQYGNFVFKVSADNVNLGKPFVAKVIPPDEEGAVHFYQEEAIYLGLMDINSNGELWPKFIESGTITINGANYQYLGIELLEGEQPSKEECLVCARTLRKEYGLIHNDLKPSNFMKLPADNGGKQMVKAFDFKHSYFVPLSEEYEPSIDHYT